MFGQIDDGSMKSTASGFPWYHSNVKRGNFVTLWSCISSHGLHCDVCIEPATEANKPIQSKANCPEWCSAHMAACVAQELPLLCSKASQLVHYRKWIVCDNNSDYYLHVSQLAGDSVRRAFRLNSVFVVVFTAPASSTVNALILYPSSCHGIWNVRIRGIDIQWSKLVQSNSWTIDQNQVFLDC